MMLGCVFIWTKKYMDERGFSGEFFKIAGSSSDLAKAQAFKRESLPDFFLVDQQIQGRGQNNKVWENSDLMISFLWNRKIREISDCEQFAWDLHKALKKTWPELVLSLKAPNDLYLNGRKTAGILLEILNQGHQKALILGLGLNVFSSPKNLKSSCLAEQAKDISYETWSLFLDHLMRFWNQRVLNSLSL